MNILYVFLVTYVASILAYSLMLIDGKRKLRFSPNEEYVKIFFFGLIPIVSYFVAILVFSVYKDRVINPAYKKLENSANELFICGDCNLSSRKHQQVSSYYNAENNNYYSPTNRDDFEYDFYYPSAPKAEYLTFYEEVSNCPHCKKNTEMKVAQESLQDAQIFFAPKISPIEAYDLFVKFSKTNKSELRKEFLSKTNVSFDFAMEQEKLFNKIQQEKFQQDLAQLNK